MNDMDDEWLFTFNRRFKSLWGVSPSDVDLEDAVSDYRDHDPRHAAYLCGEEYDLQLAVPY